MERLSKRTEQLAMVSAHVQQTSGVNSSNRYSGIRGENVPFHVEGERRGAFPRSQRHPRRCVQPEPEGFGG
jgi:hypothetical protein